MSKKRNNPLCDTGEMLDKKAKDKSYRRYRNAQYCYLAVKALAAFLLGVLAMYIFERAGV